MPLRRTGLRRVEREQRVEDAAASCSRWAATATAARALARNAASRGAATGSDTAAAARRAGSETSPQLAASDACDKAPSTRSRDVPPTLARAYSSTWDSRRNSPASPASHRVRARVCRRCSSPRSLSANRATTAASAGRPASSRQCIPVRLTTRSTPIAPAHSSAGSSTASRRSRAASGFPASSSGAGPGADAGSTTSRIVVGGRFGHGVEPAEVVSRGGGGHADREGGRSGRTYQPWNAPVHERVHRPIGVVAVQPIGSGKQDQPGSRALALRQLRQPAMTDVVGMDQHGRSDELLRHLGEQRPILAGHGDGARPREITPDDQRAHGALAQLTELGCRRRRNGLCPQLMGLEVVAAHPADERNVLGEVVEAAREAGDLADQLDARRTHQREGEQCGHLPFGQRGQHLLAGELPGGRVPPGQPEPDQGGPAPK